MPEKPNPFDGALVSLRTGFPKTFQFQVEEHVFWDLPSLAEAHAMLASMERMKEQAAAMGYIVKTAFDDCLRRWTYDFKLRPGFVKPGRDADVKHIEPAVRPDPVASLPEPAVEEKKEEASE